MKQVKIDILEQKIIINEKPITTFGICVTGENKDGKIISEVYSDISYSKIKVERFVSMIMRNDVSLVHIDEMIDDYFYSA